MDTSKIKTLQQVNAAIQSVNQARLVPNITTEEEELLEDVSLTLHELQDNLILKSEQELVDAISLSADKLSVLTEQIKTASDKLDSVSNTLQKLSTILGALVTIISTAISSGLI
ncbi:MAG TPA: hypothetical protein VNX01_13325 [Bacteroidia bacterium]|jgi:hypothetical protein|nr:hypothetical protein [Bacteroidia bacterium]